MNPYIGHASQLCGGEEFRLVGGRGDGMRLLQVRNGRGLELVISADRCADISRLSCRGLNLGYFSACGYVHPQYYEPEGMGFLQSFTAGFLTTCGLQNVGGSCEDAGERLPMHGSVGNTPAEQFFWEENEREITVKAVISDGRLFGRKLQLHREIRISKEQNSFTIEDHIRNTGNTEQPVELLYHFNMGYPLLDEDSLVQVSSQQVTPRNAHAAEDLANWARMEPPQQGYEERCYYHRCTGPSSACIYQPKHKIGLALRYDAGVLDCFTQWKMMGIGDYVLGLEPGNCYPNGRDVERAQGRLKFVQPGESLCYQVTIQVTEEQPNAD